LGGCDAAGTLAELDALSRAARRLADPGANAEARVAAVRTVLHRAGPWNDYRPFGYDHDGYRSVRAKLISHYLHTRLGNCVSMPVLFLILADRLGVDIGLALAPMHLFLRCRGGDGSEINLEATSGALPARDAWVREQRGIGEKAVASGLYMRKLSRRESVAAIALTIVEHLTAERRYQEALEAASLIAAHAPLNAFALAHQGQACFHLIRTQFLQPYRSEFLIPLPLRPRYATLLHRNRQAFAAAEALGWEPVGPTLKQETR
jgi:regulator of sirC expression with transglutaminase-like and TPR domain